ncbi:MAG: TolC family protein [Candidatus Cloacimonetes bacterium]|nr:TolC family protein [Candidatus Cloacimonadota bacterium]
MKIRYCLIMVFLITGCEFLFSENSLIDEIVERFESVYNQSNPVIFSDTIVSLDSLRLKNHNDFNHKLLINEKNILKAMQAKIKFGSIPRLNIGFGYNSYQSFERYASIYSHIPTAWDNDNPQQIDINLPNGGHGLIWVPQPTEYNWQYVPVHASYDNKVANTYGIAGFNYSFLNGVNINFLNVKSSYKLSPEDYGFPWSTVVSNTINIPLLQLLGLYFSDSEANLKSLDSEVDSKEIQIRSEQKYFSLKEKTDILNTCLQWYELKKLQKQIQLSRKQYENLRHLSELQKVNAYELFNLDQEIKALVDRKDFLINQLIVNSSQFSEEAEKILILPDSIMTESITKKLERKISEHLETENFEEIVKNSLQIKILENQITQAEINLKQSSKNSAIDLDLQIGVDMFQSDNLGYKSIWKSIEESVSNPDGYNLTGNLYLSIPLNFFSPKIGYSANKENLESKKNLRNQFIYEQKRNLEEMHFAVIRNHNEVVSQIRNYDLSRLKRENFSDMLQKSRISETDYLYYEKGLLSSEITLFNARINYIISMLSFLNTLEAE